MRHLSRLAAGLAALCVLGVAAPVADADSIAYIKEGNVWLSTPDGARQVPVTSTGGYTDVTQADDGSIVALNGVRLHRMDRSGKVLADFETPVSSNGATGTFKGPFNPMLSPDGTKLSYTYYYNTTTQDPGCMPPVCVVLVNEGGTGYSRSDRLTGWDEPGLGRHSGWLFSTWVDNDTTMLSYPTHLPNADVIADTLSDGSTGNLVHNWFTDRTEGNPYVGAGDITRDQKKVALQTGTNNSTLSIYRVPAFPRTFVDSEADPSTIPDVCYRYSNPVGGRYSQPTFAPGGDGVAWAEGDGIHSAAVPSFDAGCTMNGASPNAPLVIPGGSEPDWGPADVPAPPQVAAPAPAAHQDSKKLKATLRKVSLRAALRRGLKLRVTIPQSGRVTATAKIGRRVVARSGARKMKAGTRTVTLRFTKQARRTLARRRSARLKIGVTVAPPNGARLTTTLQARLKR